MKLKLNCGVRLVLLWASLAPGIAWSGQPPFERDTALATSMAAIGTAVSPQSFVDTDGKSLALQDYLGKPLIVSLIYTSCYHICPTTTRHLADVLSEARSLLGNDSFNVVTIGFDTARDTPAMMREFAVQQGVSDKRWKFLSGDQASVDSLSAELGFQYVPIGTGYNHLIQTTLVGADGKVAQQVYGMDFDSPLLIEPLKSFAFGVSADDGLLTSLNKRVRLFCTVYDPAMDRYKFDYSLFIGTFIGFLCVGVVGFQLVREWRKTLAAGL